MRGNFMVRFLMALLVLAIFGAYSYYHAAYTPYSDELSAAQSVSAAPLEIAATPVPETAAPTAAPLVSAEPTPEATPTAEVTPSPVPTEEAGEATPSASEESEEEESKENGDVTSTSPPANG